MSYFMRLLMVPGALRDTYTQVVWPATIQLSLTLYKNQLRPDLAVMNQSYLPKMLMWES